MLRESELINDLVRDPARKRIDRLLPEATQFDPGAVLALVIGATVAVLVSLLPL